MTFDPSAVNLTMLYARAYNLRWAELPRGVIPLTAADPDFSIAPAVKNALQSYIDGGYLSYGPAEGFKEFKEAVASNYQLKNQVSYSPENILPVDSAAFGIYLVCQALLEPGDEVIVFNPVDFLFKYAVEQVGGVAIPFDTPQSELRIDFSGLSALITPKTKMICLCNPLNPTGKVFTQEELEDLSKIAAEHDLYIMSDEIWSDIVFAPHRFCAFSSIERTYAKTITVTGYSKSYGLAGLRIGSVLCPDDTIYQKIFLKSLHQSTVHGVNVLGQVAATAALNDGQAWLGGFLQHLHKMRDLAIQELNEMPGISCSSPQGCYLVFPNIENTPYTAEELHRVLLEEAKVAVVPGMPKWFGAGAQGHIRLSFATSEEILSEGLSRIKRFLTK